MRVFQWMAEGAADYASVNQTIFFLGARMPEKVPDSAVKFYEDRFVNLWRFADEQLARTQYLAGDEITAADLAVYPIYAGRKALGWAELHQPELQENWRRARAGETLRPIEPLR